MRFRSALTQSTCLRPRPAVASLVWPWTCMLLLALCLLCAHHDALATTYFVRSDGGDSSQCNGRTDAPYQRNASRKACAWKHPSLALPPHGKARLAGGDTLLIAAGDYMIGWGSPEVAGGRCADSARWDCYLAAIPSGTRAAPTRILGQGHDSGCKAPPRLWGNERVGMVLNLQGSSNVEVSCLEITDQSDCVEFHYDSKLRCQRDTAPFGAWASVGISARASTGVRLHDLDIHGLANRGISAGGLTDWTLDRVKIIANGWAGWDGDIGDESSNSGRIVLRNVEIAWNGCGQLWQSGTVHGCWAQERGGYGDGLGTAKTGGQWLIEDSYVHHNTSDGIDLLYLDGASSTSVTLRRVKSIANAGNQIKTNGTALIENSVVVGSCAWFEGKYNMTPGDQCRALGNTLSIGLAAGQAATIRYNTLTGQGDCLILTGGGTPTSTVNVLNNVLVGHLDWRAVQQGKTTELTCGHYADNSPARLIFSGNQLWNLKSRLCPPGNHCGDNPKLANGALAGFDPTPLPGSPLVDRARPIPGVTDDFRRQRRPVGPAADIGAIEVQTHR